MLRDLTIAVVGATGAVGAEFLKIIEQRHPDLHKIKLLASSRSAGKRITVNGRELVVEETTADSFQGVDIAFISVTTQVSRQLAPIAVNSGAVVIDDSSAFRMEPSVPLVVPEVNGEDVEWHQGIIAIPNCSTTPLAMVAHPLRQLSPIVRIVADTYQSVSGAGGAAMVELREQTRTLLDGGKVTAQALPDQIGFNVIPHIDSFLDSGYTREEQKMMDESRKILHSPEVAVSATCVRVPVYISHSAAVHIEFERLVSPDEAREALAGMPGVRVVDAPAQSVYPMPWTAAGEDDVLVGRIRRDASHPNGLALWVVSDNLRKGAALNSIQIAEELVARNCLRAKHRGVRAAPRSDQSNTQDELSGEGKESEEKVAFEQDVAYFEANRAAFVKEYPGKWVAIMNRVVVDSDAQFSPLAKRVYEKYGYRAILITRVDAEPRLFRIPPPYLVRE